MNNEYENTEKDSENLDNGEQCQNDEFDYDDTGGKWEEYRCEK